MRDGFYREPLFLNLHRVFTWKSLLHSFRDGDWALWWLWFEIAWVHTSPALETKTPTPEQVERRT